MDFESQNYYLQLGIGWTWRMSIALACVPMFYVLTYIVIEWCLQSHLSTVDYKDAWKGLRITRKFRSLVQPIRNTFHTITSSMLIVWRSFAPGQVGKHQNSSLRWTSTPTLKISVSIDVETQSESAVEDYFTFSPSSQDVGLLNTNHLTSPNLSLSPSLSRSPRSSFGQMDGKEPFRPRSFN